MPGMALRTWAGEFAGGTVATAVARLNARHPWSHNDHFHSWILANLVTMVAVLHHLDAADALQQVRRTLEPGGRFLAVGLAPPQSAVDHLWDLASAVTNPMIGYAKHPWPSATGIQAPPFPVRDPAMTFDELREIVPDVLPGASMRHRLGFRHTIAWTQPS